MYHVQVNGKSLCQLPMRYRAREGQVAISVYCEMSNKARVDEGVTQLRKMHPGDDIQVTEGFCSEFPSLNAYTVPVQP